MLVHLDIGPERLSRHPERTAKASSIQNAFSRASPESTALRAARPLQQERNKHRSNFVQMFRSDWLQPSSHVATA